MSGRGRAGADPGLTFVLKKFTSVPASPSRENTCAFSKVEVVVTSFTCE